MKQYKSTSALKHNNDFKAIQHTCKVFDEVYRTYYKKSVRYAIKNLGPYKKEEAEDIVSYVWIKFLSKTQENPDLYAQILNIEAYINTMIRNRIIDITRSPKFKLNNQMKSTHTMNSTYENLNQQDAIWYRNNAYNEQDWNNDWIIAKMCLKKYCLKQSLLSPDKAHLLQDYFLHQYTLEELHRKYTMFKKAHISLILHRFYEYFKSQKSFYEIKFTEIF